MPRRQLWALLAAPILIGAVAIVCWRQPPDLPAALPPHLTDRRGVLPAGFVDDAACTPCHAEIAATFARSGMGRSWSRWASATPIEDRSSSVAPVRIGDLFYQCVFEPDRLVQREFRVNESGRAVAETRRAATYVLGSGHKGRAYIASENGYLSILPLGWYADRGVWDLNPNYREHNQRFFRQVQGICISCHNAMVATRPGAQHAYTEPLPEGIGCQRCHGPGADHVAAHKGGAGANHRDVIVNPATLPLDRQQDVCLQCHVASDQELAMPGHDAWSFRPGHRLREVRASFFLVSRGGDFQAVGHAQRSMASACYTKSGGKMTCAHCHDPHRDVRETPAGYYNRQCVNCHTRQPCTRQLSGAETPAAGDCVACHMPRRQAHDVPHTASTEHWIHRPGRQRAAPFPIPPESRDRLVAFWPDTPVEQRLAAEILCFEGRGDKPKVATAVGELQKQLGPDSPAEWRLALARGHLVAEDFARARPVLERLLGHERAQTEAGYLLARVLARTGQSKDAVDLLLENLRRWPWHEVGDALLAHLLVQERRHRELLDLEIKTLRFHAADPPRLENVARAVEALGRPRREVDAAWSSAIAADGARATTHFARATAAVDRNDAAAAETHLRAAIAAEPQAIFLRLSLVKVLASGQRWRDARKELDAILSMDPNNADARDVDRQLRRAGQ